MRIKISGFLHVAQMGNWEEVLLEQITAITSSDLAAKCDDLFVCVVGTQPIHVPKPFQILYHSDDLHLYEYETLKYIRDHSASNDGLVWYIHTKGVSKDQSEWDKNVNLYNWMGLESLKDLQRNEKEWRLYMQHFVIKKHEDCIDSLETCDVAGASWRESPFPHFSGNFWWARTDYVKRLANPYEFCEKHNWYNDKRMGAEAWIGSGSPSAKSLKNLTHNFYRWGVPIKDYLRIYL